MGRISRRCRAAAAPGPRLPGAARIGRARPGSRRAGPARSRSLRWRPALAIAGIVGLGAPVLGGTLARASASPSPSPSAQAHGAAFGRIILPDLLIVAPRGLTRQQETRLGAIAGVRNLISFDGAQITVGGKSVSAIGVNPATFRSWVPVRTASDQALWTGLDHGEFVAADAVGSRLGLKPGASYRLAGGSAERLTFGSSARLALNGVDLLVNQALSAKLGLVRQVAALISAPGVPMPTLTKAVSAILGPNGQMESLRGQQLAPGAAAGGTGSPGPGSSGRAGSSGGTGSGGAGSGGAGTGSTTSSGLPTTYLQLFQESAARYCPGLSWTVLAAIGQIESADGTNVGPSSAGALGPMQFLPSTWATWGIDGFGQTGPPDVLNPYDAVPAAARLLCADGAARGGAALSAAIFDYNHADWYVREVLQLAAAYAAEFPQ
jgi:Transglycosylase SLT domain